MNIHTFLAAWLGHPAKSDVTPTRALAPETLAPLSIVTALSPDEVRERCYQARMEVERSHLI